MISQASFVYSSMKRREHGSNKDFPSISEIQPVFADICLVLLPVPLKAHGSSITADLSCRAAWVMLGILNLTLS